MTAATKAFLAEARAEIQAVQADTATRLAEIRGKTKQLEAALADRVTQSAVRDALLDAGVNRKMITAATAFFCKTHTTKLTDDNESVIVVRDGGEEIDVATVAAEFVQDAGSPFMNAPKVSVDNRASFMRRIEQQLSARR